LQEKKQEQEEDDADAPVVKKDRSATEVVNRRNVVIKVCSSMQMLDEITDARARKKRRAGRGSAESTKKDEL